MMGKVPVIAGATGCALAAAFALAPVGAPAAPVPVGIDTAAVAKAVEPAVVDVNTTLDPLGGDGATGGAGTGMIVSPSGVIVTNNHVVSGADQDIGDIAVIKVNGLSGLPTIKWGDSSTVQVGTPVVAIGNALGLGGQPTVTQGIISATNRTITAQDETGANPETLHGLLQTDAPIAPGNSGGPLVNAAAQVIGMDTAAASAGSVGATLGFAIPSNRVKAIAGEIEAHKDVANFVYGRSAFLGVEAVASSQLANNPFGFGPFGFGGFGIGPLSATKPGVVVEAVDPGSGAARAGIQAGDEITAVDGKPVTTTAALSKAVKAHKPGQVVALTVFTGYGSEVLHVRLSEGPIDQ